MGNIANILLTECNLSKLYKKIKLKRKLDTLWPGKGEPKNYLPVISALNSKSDILTGKSKSASTWQTITVFKEPSSCSPGQASSVSTLWDSVAASVPSPCRTLASTGTELVELPRKVGQEAAGCGSHGALCATLLPDLDFCQLRLGWCSHFWASMSHYCFILSFQLIKLASWSAEKSKHSIPSYTDIFKPTLKAVYLSLLISLTWLLIRINVHANRIIVHQIKF